MKTFRRGDLIFDTSYRSDSQVYILISKHNNNDSSWWVKPLGSLQYKDSWGKYLIERFTPHADYCIKISYDLLSKEKQNTYNEFKKRFIDTDVV